MHENLDLQPRHSASHSRTSTGNLANPVPIRSVTHPEPLVAELPFTNVAAELSSFQSPVELPVSTNSLEMESIPSQSQHIQLESPEPSGPSTTRRHRHGPSSVESSGQPSPRLTWLDMDEGHRRQSSLAAPRHAFSGYSNGGRSTTEPEKGKKRDELEKLTREQQPRHLEKRDRDKVERVRIPKGISLEKVRGKEDTMRAVMEEYKREQKLMEALWQKEKEDNEFNDRLKAFGYTDEEIDSIMGVFYNGNAAR